MMTNAERRNLRLILDQLKEHTQRAQYLLDEEGTSRAQLIMAMADAKRTVNQARDVIRQISGAQTEKQENDEQKETAYSPIRNYSLTVGWDDSEGLFVARNSSLPSCSGMGDEPHIAVEQAVWAIEEHLRYREELGIPDPDTK